MGAGDRDGEAGLARALARSTESRRPRRAKRGMDPSAPDLHLGHSGVLQQLRRCQNLGHTPIFLVGDFTARIGDPSGKKATRPALEPAEQRALLAFLALL